MNKKDPTEDFIKFRGNIQYNCVDYTNLSQGINFENSSNAFIQELIALCQGELADREIKNKTEALTDKEG